MLRKSLAIAMSLIMTSPIINVNEKNIVYANEKDYNLNNPRVNYMEREIVTFGRYWIEDTDGNGVVNGIDKKTPIKWQVLSENNGELFLLSDVILTQYPYNTNGVKDENGKVSYACDWSTSTLRKWLNSEFLDNAFPDDKGKISSSKVINSGNTYYNIPGASATSDKVFLLSYDEIVSYGFDRYDSSYDVARTCDKSRYANYDERRYMLRTSGKTKEYCMNVDSVTGKVNVDGALNNNYYMGVRPAIKIKREYVNSVEVRKIKTIDAEYDSVSLGRYNGEKIKWRVLSRDNNDVFLLADNILTNKKYNDDLVSSTWENCTLRKWLNEELYNEIFDENEKKIIKETYVENKDNPTTGAWGGNDTYDKIFLLSIEDLKEAKYGFLGNDYDLETRIGYDLKGSVSGWWLRSPSSSATIVSLVGYNGRISNSYINSPFGIRPAIHIDLKDAELVLTEDEVVDTVIDMIDSLPLVEEVKLSDKKEIDECIKMFESLSTEQKEKISKELYAKYSVLRIAISYLESINQLEEEISNKSNLLTEAQELVEQLNIQIQELQSEKESNTSLINQLKEDKQDLEDEIKELNSSVESLENSKNQIEEDKNNIIKSKDELIDALTSNNESLNDLLKQANEQKNAYSSELDSMKEQNKKMSETISSLKSDLSKINNKKTELESTVANLEKQLKDNKNNPSVDIKLKAGDVVVDNVSKAKYKILKMGTDNAMGTVEFVAPLNANNSKFIVPSTITNKGITYEVIQIVDGAFKDNKKLKNVVISEGIKKIGKESFAGCKKLRKITINTTVLKKVGKNAFKGIHKKCVIKVPSNKFKNYKKKFKKKGQSKKVKIKKI